MRLGWPARRTAAPVLTPTALPRHVGVVLDGNRRWAHAAGHLDPSVGHKYGADHVEDLLQWCTDWGIEHLTTYVMSADNIRKRPPEQVEFLFELLAGRLPELILSSGGWALHVSGDLDLLPARVRDALAAAELATADRPAHLTLAVGYDGHGDIVDGIRRALAEHGPDIDESAITAGLGGGPVKEIDLVIRTSGELRLSGFFPWQTADAEIYVAPNSGPTSTRTTSPQRCAITPRVDSDGRQATGLPGRRVTTE